MREMHTNKMSGKIETKNNNKIRWTRKNRVLVLSERGISFRTRHLMLDIISMMPQSKTENKVEKDLSVEDINELCDLRNCKFCLFFQMKKHKDTYLWISAIEKGPSIKFLIEGSKLNVIEYKYTIGELVYTVDELSFKGNCLKGSRPVLSFSKEFDDETNNENNYLCVVKKLLIHTFGVPSGHPKSKPFIDHCICFSLLDGKIWVRNYQIVYPDTVASTKTSTKQLEMVEIGPRFIMTPIALFKGSFCGSVLYKNASYVSPNTVRSLEKKREGIHTKIKFASNVFNKQVNQIRKLPEDPIDKIFK